MSGSWVFALIPAAIIGAVLTPLLARHGLALTTSSRAHPRYLLPTSAGGATAGTIAVLAAVHASNWWATPALMLWACTLVAAATCDAVTQRIPTPLIRQGAVATSALLIAGLSTHHDWRGLVVTAIAADASGLLLLFGWRFAGAGFGDVRLASLGGLGLGHATTQGLALGVVAFGVVILIQARVAVVRGGNRQTMLPMGPGLALGFLLAATCSTL